MYEEQGYIAFHKNALVTKSVTLAQAPRNAILIACLHNFPLGHPGETGHMNH